MAATIIETAFDLDGNFSLDNRKIKAPVARGMETVLRNDMKAGVAEHHVVKRRIAHCSLSGIAQLHAEELLSFMLRVEHFNLIRVHPVVECYPGIVGFFIEIAVIVVMVEIISTAQAFADIQLIVLFLCLIVEKAGA